LEASRQQRIQRWELNESNETLPMLQQQTPSFAPLPIIPPPSSSSLPLNPVLSTYVGFNIF
jgi:hypothetical protein